jgi:hypothetical protein
MALVAVWQFVAVNAAGKSNTKRPGYCKFYNTSNSKTIVLLLVSLPTTIKIESQNI